jgi:flagellar motor switch protein FliM
VARGQQASAAGGDGPERPAGQRFDRIGPLSVRLDAVIGSATVTLGSLRHLRVGTTVVLAEKVDDPITLVIGGVPVFEGIPYSSNGRFAVRVSRVASPARRP